jgi:hypothetical protein
LYNFENSTKWPHRNDLGCCTKKKIKCSFVVVGTGMICTQILAKDNRALQTSAMGKHTQGLGL